MEDHSPWDRQAWEGVPRRELVGKQNPKSSALTAPLMPHDPPLPGFLNCALNTKPHGAGLCTACVALRGLQKDYLRKKWAQFVLTPLLVSDCHQQPKAENPALPISWRPATQAARPVPPTPFDLPLSKAFKCSKPRPCLQEPGVRILESGCRAGESTVLHSSFWGRHPVIGEGFFYIYI